MISLGRLVTTIIDVRSMDNRNPHCTYSSLALKTLLMFVKRYERTDYVLYVCRISNIGPQHLLSGYLLSLQTPIQTWFSVTLTDSTYF